MSTFNINPGPGLLAFREQEQQDPSNLINFLTTRRKDQLANFCFHNLDEILELEQEFGKYIFVPLALPKFELLDKDHFVSWWNTHAIKPTKLVSEQLSPETGYSSAEAVDLIEKIKHYWDPNFQTENFKNEFPNLWEQFHDLLPIDDFLTLHLWSSFKPFTEHRDPGELLDVPMSFRIKLYDDNPEETLYIFDNPTNPYQMGEVKQLPQLETTNSWVWNNLRVKHGSIYNINYKKCLVITTGILNIKKYKALLTTSINTYKDHCMISEHSLKNYVNI